MTFLQAVAQHSEGRPVSEETTPSSLRTHFQLNRDSLLFIFFELSFHFQKSPKTKLKPITSTPESRRKHKIKTATMISFSSRSLEAGLLICFAVFAVGFAGLMEKNETVDQFNTESFRAGKFQPLNCPSDWFFLRRICNQRTARCDLPIMKSHHLHPIA
jgi:hypothetical protein